MAAESRGDQRLLLAHWEADCLRRWQNATPPPGHCPAQWDGLLCWPNSAPAELTALSCPAYVIGFHPEGTATRQCGPNGDWLPAGKPWTNYSDCYSAPLATIFVNVSRPDVSFVKDYMRTLMTISQIGYVVSLCTLIVAFGILASFKRLRCPRNRLHLHLFASFMLRAAVYLLKDSLFVQGLGLESDIETYQGGFVFVEEDNWPCKVMMSVWQYFILANYSWILMEGLYLHNLVFLALFTDTSAITLYVILGWGLPVLFVAPWVAVRATLEDDLCWTSSPSGGHAYLLIQVPTMVSIVINFILFINIARVLLSKLRSSVCDETGAFRRWARSTLVLVPLFGVHYALFLTMSYTAGYHPIVELTWLFGDQIFASFQGFFVAVLYCFMNGEVRTELRRCQCPGLPPGARFCKPQPSLCYSSTSCTSLSGDRRWAERAHNAGGGLRKLQSPLCTEQPRTTNCSYVSTVGSRARRGRRIAALCCSGSQPAAHVPISEEIMEHVELRPFANR